MSSKDRDEIKRLDTAVANAREAVDEGNAQNVSDSEAEERDKTLQDARDARNRYQQNMIDRKKKLRADWFDSAADTQEAIHSYLTSFPDE